MSNDNKDSIICINDFDSIDDDTDIFDKNVLNEKLCYKVKDDIDITGKIYGNKYKYKKISYKQLEKNINEQY